jgi:hypothetical protein
LTSSSLKVAVGRNARVRLSDYVLSEKFNAARRPSEQKRLKIFAAAFDRMPEIGLAAINASAGRRANVIFIFWVLSAG